MISNFRTKLLINKNVIWEQNVKKINVSQKPDFLSLSTKCHVFLTFPLSVLEPPYRCSGGCVRGVTKLFKLRGRGLERGTKQQVLYCRCLHKVLVYMGPSFCLTGDLCIELALTVPPPPAHLLFTKVCLQYHYLLYFLFSASKF